MLEVHDLCKSFGGVAAVKQVSARFERGRISAIIGPNGAGKTTLFNLVAGFHKPDSGRIVFDGRDVGGLRPDQMALCGIARSFQSTHLFDQASVLDNLIVGHRLRTSSTFRDVLFATKRLKREEQECREVARDALAFVGLAGIADRLAGEISQEERKRVAFALALATKPKMLLLDEPAGGINPEETLGLSSLIRKMVASGLSVCLIEHKMAMVMELADWIVVLDHGEKIAEGPPEEIRANGRVIEAYLGVDHAAA